jgi:hypothetical protein
MLPKQKRYIEGSVRIPGPVGWLLTMSDSGIPEKVLPAVRLAVFWIGLPFIGLLLGSERISDGKLYESAAWFGCALLSVIIAVYWDKIIPRRFRDRPQTLEYLRYKDSELGSTIRDMAWVSAWGKWYAAQILVNSSRPAAQEQVLHIAAHQVQDQLVNGDLEVRGRSPGSMEYQTIPRTHWRSSALHFIADPMTIWKMIILPRGGASIDPDGTIIASDQKAEQRTASIRSYDSLIVDGFQFEKLWPKKEPDADKKRLQFLRQAMKRGLDKDEIKRLSGLGADWQLQLLRLPFACAILR